MSIPTHKNVQRPGDKCGTLKRRQALKVSAEFQKVFTNHQYQNMVQYLSFST